MDGCTVDARADGADVTGEAVAGVIAGVHAYGVYLYDAGACSVGCRFSVDASWLDAAGADGGVGCTSGSLVSVRFVAPAGGAFGAGGVVDDSGAMAPHVGDRA